MKRCSSPLGYLQEDYWSRYHSNEKSLYEQTADTHARLLAAENIKSFFGFVALDKEEKQQLAEIQSARPVSSTDWNRVTGVYLYREKNGMPLYSRLNKWAMYSQEENTEDMVKELDMLWTHFLRLCPGTSRMEASENIKPAGQHTDFRENQVIVQLIVL